MAVYAYFKNKAKKPTTKYFDGTWIKELNVIEEVRSINNY